MIKNKKTMALLIALIILTLIFLYGITLYPHSTTRPSGGSLEPPSIAHFLGTDDLGVDIFAQISKGYFHSIAIGICAAAISFILGGALGLISGYFGGVIDNIISFIINLFLSIPQLPIMIVIGAFFGQSVWNIILIVALFSWARIAKIVRAKTISIREMDYIILAKSYGGSFLHNIKTHMLPDIMPILLVNSLAVIGKAIIQEASLAFLGLSDPTSKSWGLMINKAINFKGIYFTNYWTWWLLPPLIAMIITILCVRLIAKNVEKQMTET